MKLLDKARILVFKIFGWRFGWGRRHGAASWNRSYAQGKWDYMYGPEEAVRYNELASYFVSDTPTSILDVACGEGILLEHFLRIGYEPSRYLGLDIAGTAIAKARRRHPGFSFDVADAETYWPGERFDRIVLNECLYYFPRPMKVLQQLESGLAPGGAFLVSVYHPPDEAYMYQPFWDNLASSYECVGSKEIKNAKNITWKIGLFRPARLAAV